MIIPLDIVGFYSAALNDPPHYLLIFVWTVPAKTTASVKQFKDGKWVDAGTTFTNHSNNPDQRYFVIGPDFGHFPRLETVA